MDGYILRDKRESVTLPAAAVDRLLQSGQGDAALLYLALRRFGRGVTPEELEKALPISRLRIDAAEKRLQELSLLPRPEHPVPPAPAEERPVYTTQDIAGLITDNEGFRLLIPQTEQQLGKKLRTPDLQILAGLYDDVLDAVFQFDILNDGGIILVESMRGTALPEARAPYVRGRQYNYGKVSLTAYSRGTT